MERNKFHQIIDSLAANWYIDTAEPVVSRVRRKDGTYAEGRRAPERAKDWEGPNWTGVVQIVNWQPRTRYCEQCGEIVSNVSQNIDLKKQRVKCFDERGKIKCFFNLDKLKK